MKWFLPELGHLGLCVFNRRFFTPASGNVANSLLASSSCRAVCIAQSSAGARQRDSFTVNEVEPRHATEDATPWDSACSVKYPGATWALSCSTSNFSHHGTHLSKACLHFCAFIFRLWYNGTCHAWVFLVLLADWKHILLWFGFVSSTSILD